MMISKTTTPFMAAAFAAVCLLALSACKKENAEIAYNGKPLDPMCMMAAAEPEGVNLAECTGSVDKTDDTKSAKGLETFEDGAIGYTFECEDGCMRPPFVSYKFIGRTDAGDVLKVTSSGGGTGVFSDVRVVTIEGDVLKQTIINGGDRCNGGIDNVSVDGQVVKYGQNITPFDLVDISGGNKVGFEAYDDIAACAACCVGVAQYAGSEVEGVEFTADAVEDAAGEGYSPIDTCFYGVYNDVVRAGNKTLDRDQLDEFGASFAARCSDLKTHSTASR